MDWLAIIPEKNTMTMSFYHYPIINTTILIYYTYGWYTMVGNNYIYIYIHIYIYIYILIHYNIYIYTYVDKYANMHPYMPDESMVGKYTRTNINHRYTIDIPDLWQVYIIIYI